MGAVVVAATALPLADASATAVINLEALVHRSATAPAYPWPTVGSAAVSVPSLNVVATSPHQKVQPIASLTKMMTAYVILHQLPLDPGETGPCLTVSHFDVTLYLEDQLTDQSSIKVAYGEQLCEDQLLAGLFVHSAGNFAVMLVHLAHRSLHAFVHDMNATAQSLGMDHTRYHDVTGLSDLSISTAADQILVVDHLMSYLVIRQIVRQASVRLPVAGVVSTYTPLLGTGGVVGIKSGFTDAAGLCDAMAVQRAKDGISFLTFAVDLGQLGTLTNAGDIDYSIAITAIHQVEATTYAAGQVVGTLGWRGASTNLMLAQTTSALWWEHTPNLELAIAPYAGVGNAVSSPDPTTMPAQLWSWTDVPGSYAVAFSTAPTIPAGTVVGDVEFRGDADIYLVLYSATTISRPPWWTGLL
jgi:serine-type D-Ala-D-Ala carboxypeptidase (penicillin-binding protein 5/6)